MRSVRAPAVAVLVAGLAAAAAAPGAVALAPKAASLAPGEVVVIRLAGRHPAPRGAELRVRGRPVARLFGAAAWRRLRIAGRRLDRPFIPPVAVSVEVRGREARLVVDGAVVLTADRPDAARERTVPVTLARRWARALEDALAVPAISVSPSSVVLSPGGSIAAAVTTVAPGPVVVGAFDRQIADVRLDAGAVRIMGRRPGTTVVPLRLGPYRTELAISVRRPAGTIPRTTEVVVTGASAPPGLIREAIERHLHQAVRRDPGASVDLGPITVDSPLAPGESKSVPVSVGIRSPYGGPADGLVNVSVTNAPIRISDPEVLLVSNRPETITGNGRLFQETLAPNRPARLLYHHMNGTPSQARILKVTLSNPGATRARVHYLSGLAGPSPDPILIGHVATARFLSALVSGLGYVVEVPPRGATAFTAYTLAPMALVSGLMQFQVVEGGPVELTMHVRLPWLLDRTVTTDLGPWAFPHPRGTFPGSVVDVARDLPAHQPAVLGDLGVMSELRDVRTGEPLVGDYGVLYRFRLRLVNPTDREVTTVLLANAAGGPARGLFLIDGVAADIGLLQPNEERTVAAFTLGPGSAREIVLLTMPIAGSFYPVRLSVRPR